MSEDLSTSIGHDVTTKPEIGPSKRIAIAETYANSPVLQGMSAISGVPQPAGDIDAEEGEGIKQAPTECTPGAPADDADPVETANRDREDKIATAEEVSSSRGKKAKRSTYWFTVVKISENRYECRPARHGVKWPDGQGKLTRIRRDAMLAKYRCMCRIADYLTTYCQEFLASGDPETMVKAMAENEACQNGDMCPFVQKEFHADLLRSQDKGSFPDYSGFTRIIKTVIIRWGSRTDFQLKPLSKFFSRENAKKWQGFREERTLGEIAKEIRIVCEQQDMGTWPREQDWTAIATARGSGKNLTTFQSNILALIRSRGKKSDLAARIGKLQSYETADDPVSVK